MHISITNKRQPKGEPLTWYGRARSLDSHTVSCQAASAPPAALPDAYEQVLLDALRSDKTLFATSDEIVAAWKVLEPLQQAWSMDPEKLVLYPRGSSLEEITTPR